MNSIIGSTNGVIVAGVTLKAGVNDSELNSPTAVFLTRDQTLFILDSGNFRVQKWKYGDSFGSTVAGGQGFGTTLDKISRSYGLYVDDEYNVYVSEYDNHRVTVWMSENATVGHLVCSFTRVYIIHMTFYLNLI